MNCSWLQSVIRYECNPCESVNGEPGLDVRTPFAWIDGEPIGFFVIDQGETILISDNGDTIFHFHSLGMLSGGKRSWGQIRSIASVRDVHLSDEGEMYSLGNKENAEALVSNFIATLMSIADYQRDNAGISENINRFADEVELLLREWKPTEPLERGYKLTGLSRKEHQFDFRLGNKIISAVQPNAAATGSLMRKFGDIKGGIDSSDLELLAIIDDRHDAAKAEEEIKIVSSLVRAVPFSNLKKAATKVSTERKNHLH